MSLEKLRVISLLSDFYGSLLTEKQQQFLKLHYEDDWSYGEIAAHFGITRQAAHDSIRSSALALERYETKLGFLADFQRRQHLLSDVLEHLRFLETTPAGSEGVRTIEEIRKRVSVLMN